MFIRCFIEMTATFAEVDAALTSDGRAWLPDLAAAAMIQSTAATGMSLAE